MNTSYTETGATSPPLARARAKVRPSAHFNEYVMAYTRMQRANVLLIFAGVAVLIGATMYTEGVATVLCVALGLGLAGGGGGGLAIAAAAHASFTACMATIEEHTYTEAPPPAEGVRPFVASSNGAATVRAGRFALPPATWAALFDGAAAAGGRLTRDGAAKVLPRHLYRDWQTTLGELHRLQLVDAEGRPTAAAWALIGRTPPRPAGDEWPAGTHSTHARRTHGAHGGGVVES